MIMQKAGNGKTGRVNYLGRKEVLEKALMTGEGAQLKGSQQLFEEKKRYPQPHY